MKTKLVSSITIASILAALLISMFMAFPVYAQQRGPVIDMVRLKTVKSPDAELIAMQTETTHFLPDMIRTGDIEKLDGDGFTISSAPGFHMGHIGTNIRADQSYRTDRPAGELPYVAAVLSDVAFRHAMLHCYDQDGILASIYKYIVTKSTSLVPPALGGWVSPTTAGHPFNPGDPFTSTSSDHDACGILIAAGYNFNDAGTIGVVDSADSWSHPSYGTTPIPTLSLFTPTYEVAPTSAEHGARLITEMHNIGLNNMVHVPHEFSPYITKVFQNAEFDLYMVFWSLGRFPDHLYDMLHSSQDCATFPWRYNAPGVDQTYVDTRAETIKFGLVHSAKMTAAHEVQDWLYNDANPQAFPYIQLYSRVYFVASNPDLRGIVNSPGYGADNSWTWLNWYWEPGLERYDAGKTIVIYSNGESPERLNPHYSSTVYAWNVMGPSLDGLMSVNPYTHEDLPWLADSWTVTPTATGMEIDFDLNETGVWHDGNTYTAEDARFNMLFMRDWQIPRYTSAWEKINDVQVTASGAGGSIKVILDETSQFLLYDVAGIAALLPQPVWNKGAAPTYGWASQTAVLGYDPSNIVAAPTGARSGTMTRYGASDGAQNHLYGTGPYVFQFYDPVGDYADTWANRHYFKSTQELADWKRAMFHAVGDVNYNGVNEILDLARMGASYGLFVWDTGFDPDANVNGDNVVDIRDISVLSAHYGDQKEWP